MPSTAETPPRKAERPADEETSQTGIGTLIARLAIIFDLTVLVILGVGLLGLFLLKK